MPSVLVVNDSAVDRRLVGELLKEDAGFGEILFASNGREAMELLKEEQPSVVVTDLMMPEMDGFELVAAVNANYPSIPVVLMTGRGSEEIAVQALRAGAASYVPKNAIGDRLVETMRMVFDIAREKRAQ